MRRRQRQTTVESKDTVAGFGSAIGDRTRTRFSSFRLNRVQPGYTNGYTFLSPSGIHIARWIHSEHANHVRLRASIQSASSTGSKMYFRPIRYARMEPFLTHSPRHFRSTLRSAVTSLVPRNAFRSRSLLTIAFGLGEPALLFTLLAGEGFCWADWIGFSGMRATKSYFKSVDVKSSRPRISGCATKAADPEGTKDSGAQSPSAAGRAGDLPGRTRGLGRAAPHLRRLHRAQRTQRLHRQHRQAGCRPEGRSERSSQRSSASRRLICADRLRRGGAYCPFQ